MEEITNFTEEEYDTMESHRNRFTEIRVIYEKNYNKHDQKTLAGTPYPVAESCLPTEVLKAWNGHRLNRKVSEYLALEKEKVLENLMTFLRHEVEVEEHRISAENGFGRKTKLMESHKQVQQDEPTATTPAANAHAGKISCIFCDHPHSSQDSQKMSKRRVTKTETERLCVGDAVLFALNMVIWQKIVTIMLNT
ncbi:transposable element Tc1 transposase [Trichonephila inaurata madagascariensis]|uniref:Transposable element Tc1 transposase n=1 Tax=Trichonephila inaurata madagascariensis TaxID=2747483 RepID=A0A8X7CIW2_9ARAC|nr:transposable element Tc1 transposase [Trichonephila inaurata madagascariensis]